MFQDKVGLPRSSPVTQCEGMTTVGLSILDTNGPFYYLDFHINDPPDIGHMQITQEQ